MTPKAPHAYPALPGDRNRRRSMLFALLTLVVSGIAQPLAESSDERSVGFVAGMQGSWISSRTETPLQPIDPVFAGEQIAPKTPPLEGSFISIALYDGTKATMRCRSADDCDPVYRVPQVNNPDSFLTRATEAIRQLYPTQIKKLVISASRGPSGSSPSEAVLKVKTNGVVDLAPALHAVAPGSYTAHLVAWPRQDDTQVAAISGALTWSSPVADWKPARHVSPGVYQLELTDASGDTVGPRVMVMVQTAAEYTKFREAFERFNQTTSLWNLEDDAGIMRLLRIGFLVALWRDPSLAE